MATERVATPPLGQKRENLQGVWKTHEKMVASGYPSPSQREYEKGVRTIDKLTTTYRDKG